MDKLIKTLIKVLPWCIVAALLFRYWVEQQPTTVTIEIPAEQETFDETANLPIYQVVEGSVYDGDTIRVTDGTNELKVRFACIDAPEKQQPGGIEARDELKRLLESDGNRVKLNIITTDRYGRNVAEVWTREGLVQSQLVSLGLVYPYEQYKSDCPSWDAVERAGEYAIANSLGVWGDRNAVKPWDYRKK